MILSPLFLQFDRSVCTPEALKLCSVPPSSTVAGGMPPLSFRAVTTAYVLADMNLTPLYSTLDWGR